MAHFTYSREHGRGGTDCFQIISIELDEQDVTRQIDQGVHFADENELLDYLTRTFKLPKDEITLECDSVENVDRFP